MKYLDTFYLFRKASSVTSVFLFRCRVRISPNWFTLASIALFVLALYLAYAGNYIGIPLIFLSLFFDFLDGEYARITDQTSNFGRALDELSDTAKIPILMFAYFFSSGMPSLAIIIALLWMSFLRMKLLVKNHEIKVADPRVKAALVKKSVFRQVLANVPQLYYANVEIIMVYLVISDNWFAGWLFAGLIFYNLCRILKKYIEEVFA